MQDTTPPIATEAPDQRLRLPELVEYRRAATLRRAAAFCDAPEYVLGQEVRPLTPRTFSMLVAVESHFILGGRPTEGDVRNYLWFHSPLWCHAGVAGWQRRKARALRTLTRELASPVRRAFRLRLDVGRYYSALNLAITDIRRIVDEAFADCPAPSGPGGPPVATMEASLINTFAVEYHWAPEQTRNMPLRQIFQLVRCLRAARGEDVADRGEQEILERHLRRRLAAMKKPVEDISHG